MRSSQVMTETVIGQLDKVVFDTISTKAKKPPKHPALLKPRIQTVQKERPLTSNDQYKRVPFEPKATLSSSLGRSTLFQTKPDLATNHFSVGASSKFILPSAIIVENNPKSTFQRSNSLKSLASTPLIAHHPVLTKDKHPSKFIKFKPFKSKEHQIFAYQNPTAPAERIFKYHAEPLHAGKLSITTSEKVKHTYKSK